MGVHVLHTKHGILEMQRTMMEVTSISRPDIDWRYADPSGHQHAWHVVGETLPAENYNASKCYIVPSVEFIKTGESCFEDSDVPYSIGELRCKQCAAVVVPGQCPDDTQQFIEGITYYRIDGRGVSKEEFQRVMKLVREDEG